MNYANFVMIMSTLIYRISSCLVLLALIAQPRVMAEDEQDPVLDYYWQKAGREFRRMDPVTTEIEYRLVARTFYKDIDSDGEVVRVDTAMVEYFYSGGERDSLRVISGDNSRFKDIDLSVQNVFAIGYHLYAYPNDTGGAVLPIGLDTDSGSVDPDGFVIIDRDNGRLQWLYLYYPKGSGHRRVSRCFRMSEVDGYLFPDSVWEVGAIERVFVLDHYRVETAITEVEIRR
ncbi:MAG: hypothetical protein JSU65_00880 [Candidatus Zixiibacteriota bacterium]|nr:MAG: hypothetical protein JSU65_00880 [candidate division Zixibacteria bacterium]